MSNRIKSWNTYESTLNGGIDENTGTITVQSVDNLPVDTFLVIDPDIPGSRDFVFVTAIDNGLKQLTVRTPRPEEGSTGGTGHAHSDGAVIRAVPVHQWLDVIFDDIEALEAWDAAHAPGTDPHPQYLDQSDGDARYVELAGDTMTGDLVLPGPPDADLKATTKKYVDDSQSFLHEDLTDVATDQHHTKYTDAEAVSASQAAPGTVIASSDFVSAGEVADATVLHTFFMPNVPGQIALLILSGTVGFVGGVQVIAGFDITGTGVTQTSGGKSLAHASQWAAANAVARISCDGQLVSIVADADGDSNYAGGYTAAITY